MSRAEKLATISVDVEELSDLADQVQEIETAIVRANTNAQEIDSISDSLEELSAINSIYNSGISYSTDGVNEYFDANTPNNTLTSTEFVEMNLTNPQEGDLMSFDAAANNWINSTAPEEPIPVLSFRNKIINGNFQVNQRNDSNANRNLSHTLHQPEADRWRVARANVGGNGRTNVSYVNGGIKYQISEAVTPITSSAFFTIRQIIEGYNCAELPGEQVTLSFKVRTNKAGNYGVVVQGHAQSITVSSEDASSENKVFYSKTFTVPSDIAIDHTAGIQVDICLAADSDRAGQYFEADGTQANLFDSTANYFELYEVQLEKGSVATTFEQRPYGLELSLCQRYYQIIETSHSLYGADQGGITRGYTTFITTMRVIPTVTFTGSTYGWVSSTTSSVTYSNVSPTIIPSVKLNAEL